MEDKILKLEYKFQEMIKDLDVEIIYCDYETEGGYNYLRVYLEKEDGYIGLDDCEKVSRIISDEADKNINESFILEVSSPGIERKLKREKDFLKFIGQRISVKTRSNIQNTKSFEGVLQGFENSNIQLLDDELGEVIIPLEKVKIAKNIYDFKKELGEGNES